MKRWNGWGDEQTTYPLPELSPVESSSNLWAEIRWAAKSEGIVHLEDLLLRRV
jgi:glycerol-3-phosphate dehydrogenase